LKSTVLKSQGQGECGKVGYISSYTGMVTCQECKSIAEQDDRQAQTKIKSQLFNWFSG
jgi:hypothetical protein